jgi:hypothetical protein
MMDIESLKLELNRRNISPTLYSLDGNLEPGRLNLEKLELRWLVFYFEERGEMGIQQAFPSESEACQYILERLIEEKRS